MEENKQEESNKDIKKEIVSRSKLLEAGVYFGTRKAQWNPKMKPYILTTKRGSHIIDIQKTKKALELAYQIIYKFAQKGATFIFVGTKKQAKKTIRENALRTNSLYVSERWLGGTLTNSRTIFKRVKRLEELEKLSENNFENYTKKEGVMFQKELNKLTHNLSGIRNMKQKPNVMIVADPLGDAIAIKEAQKLGVKIIGIADTNVDPQNLDIFVPANDDSTKSVTLIITILADAIASAKNGRTLFAYQGDEAIELPQEKAPEFKKRRFEGNSFRRRSANFRRDREEGSVEGKTIEERKLDRKKEAKPKHEVKEQSKEVKEQKKETSIPKEQVTNQEKPKQETVKVNKEVTKEKVVKEKEV